MVDIHLMGAFTVPRPRCPFLPTDGTGPHHQCHLLGRIIGTLGQVNYSAAKAGSSA